MSMQTAVLAPQIVNSRPPIQILVVDDEEPLRRLLRAILEGAGYKVTSAGHASEALSLFSQATFDIVLVDVMMPDMDGHTLCTEFRKLSDVPIIMISALNRPQAIVEGFAAGADDYITKPFQLRDINLRIKALLRYITRCKVGSMLQAA